MIDFVNFSKNGESRALRLINFEKKTECKKLEICILYSEFF
ncbi:hypothetical protein HP15_118 [Marinobacter adhaerens HP15]|uniref:Uncharacterized protein n=1 Tax=Marinobacter adhaerens (strain DSM 23420 / HP15) TaxID=225937 RepID=E4PJ63_MARAH|nr:hypothetical protein HP15_118 [Marinobacter adhaerens HP15]